MKTASSSIRRLARTVVAAAVLFSVATPRLWAWGYKGHRLVADVAEAYLTRQAKLDIIELLHHESLADVSNWADEYRTEAPETKPWHYVDIPGTADKFDRDRDCPLSATDPKSPWRDCITDRILYFEGRLGDQAYSPKERVIALKFLVHLIGDLHQPFHAIGDARGGNSTRVVLLGPTQCGTQTCNLHSVWDNSFIEDQNLSEAKYTARLLEEIKVNHWERFAGGEPTAWANASHHYAVLAEMPSGAALMQDYVTEETRVVDAQLALAGLRLAHVLNRIFDEEPEQHGGSELKPHPATLPATTEPK